jgi:hypothetical protein
MKKTDIDKILKEGSGRQKIKLYFTDVAHFNTVGIYTADVKGSTKEKKTKILTDEEKQFIFNSIEKKDIKYYEELRVYNKAFLLFKPSIATYSKNFDWITAKLSKEAVMKLLHTIYQETINDILEIVEDKKDKDEIIKVSLNSLKQLDALVYQEKGSKPYIRIPLAHINNNLLLIVELINEKTVEAKEFIKGIEDFLNKCLPLSPYKQFVKDNERKIIANIKECQKMIEEIGIDEINEDKFKILNWEDIVVNLTEEDLQDIKNAGL